MIIISSATLCVTPSKLSAPAGKRRCKKAGKRRCKKAGKRRCKEAGKRRCKKAAKRRCKKAAKRRCKKGCETPMQERCEEPMQEAPTQECCAIRVTFIELGPSVLNFERYKVSLPYKPILLTHYSLQ